MERNSSRSSINFL